MTTRMRIGTKAQMIEDIIEEVKHTIENHPDKIENALDIVREAMRVSVKASALRDFMKYDFGPMMIQESDTDGELE